MTRDVSNRLLALLVALALPAGAAAQPKAQKPPEPAKVQSAPPASTKPAAQAQHPTPKEAAAGQKPSTRQPAAPTGVKPGQPQAAAPAVAPAVARPAAKSATQVAAPVFDAYSYRPEGRRDPFVSLLNRGTDPRTKKVEGLAGMMAGDIVLKGTLQSRGSFLAIVQGPDAKRQLIVRPNDRFADGVVKAITADSMVILQEVNDPLSLTKQREIRKTLRAVEEVK